VDVGVKGGLHGATAFWGGFSHRNKSTGRTDSNEIMIPSLIEYTCRAFDVTVRDVTTAGSS
jgi:hypothetical protein